MGGRVDPRRSPARSLALTLVAAIAVACNAEVVTPTGTAPGSGSPPSSASSAPVLGGPDVTPPPAVTETAALPEPTLDDPAAIGAALNKPRTRAQGVVSMLRGLGIGIYAADGSPIRAGDETGPNDLWLYEGEVRALIEMAARELEGDFITFPEWHAGLQALGLAMSAEDLAAAYEETYFEKEGSFFVRLVRSTGIDIHPEAGLSHLQAWLLLLDGFVVRPNTTALGPMAMAEPAFLAVESDKDRWGGASSRIPQLTLPGGQLSPDELAMLMARLETLTRTVRFSIDPMLPRAHEGHGGAGSPTGLTLWFTPALETLVAPLGGSFVLVAQPVSQGLFVTWRASAPSVLSEHGTMRDAAGLDPFSGAPSFTDSIGRIPLAYTPRTEEADGQGVVATDVVRVRASADLREIARHSWFFPEQLLVFLYGERIADAWLEIEWHEAEGLRIDLTDEYDVTIELLPGAVGRGVGTDHFSGFIAQQSDGTWRGIVRGTADGAWTWEGPGACSTSLSGTQDLLVIGRLLRNDHQGRELGLRFYPISPPELGPMGCEWEPRRWEGDPATGVPPEDYAPFNSTDLTDPDLGGVRTGLPPSGTATFVYEERVPGLAAATRTVTIERVKPEP